MQLRYAIRTIVTGIISGPVCLKMLKIFAKSPRNR